ncbi:MAG: hypothetical protein JF595_07345 [Sphingomonadales bacterium]|nr:hypothetical protein [Sphingomonadales bacterium]
MSIAAEGLRMANDPPAYFGGSARAAHRLPRRDAEAMQLAALQQRFADLRERLPVLKAAADEQGISGFSRVEDGTALLFPHTVYKSYPVSLLEKNRFAPLTKWLGRLTTVDLSGADVDECDGIDAWLAALERGAGLSPTHSSGTSGTMTFLPRTAHDHRMVSEVFGMTSRDFNELDDRPGSNEPWHTFYLGFKGGRSHAGRAAGWALDNFARSEEYFHTLYDIDMSSDVMFMAARVRRAEARGELSQLQASPAMKARQAEFEAVQRNSAEALDRIFSQLLSLKGERVYVGGMSGTLTDLAIRALEQGHRNIFEGNCVVQCGGGGKGGKLPDDWEALCLDFTGADRIGQYYGMTEVTMITSKCSKGHYHVPPWVITYVLDPNTGAVRPREGAQTGRAAFFDLVPQTYWGGFATGDEITADWSPCPCGRETVHLHPAIQRFSEKQGGDDKITCAAADDAHAAAIDFLASAQ